jgi:nicotinic acid mononucleotide adenylyltransferase
VPGVGAYPGTFDPPTVAHMAIAEAAWQQGGLDRIEMLVAEFPLGKDQPRTPLAWRLSALAEVAAGHVWLAVRATRGGLLASLAAGYDALVLGADKWAQLLDPAWYAGSVERRDQALASLPRLLVAPRAGFALDPRSFEALPAGAVILNLPHSLAEVSSSAVRAGRKDWEATNL